MSKHRNKHKKGQHKIKKIKNSDIDKHKHKHDKQSQKDLPQAAISLPLDKDLIHIINDPAFGEISDGEVVLGGKRVPFVQAMLRYRSKVLRDMPSHGQSSSSGSGSASAEGWAAGLLRSFDLPGITDESIRMFIAVIHDCDMERAAKHFDTKTDLLGVLMLADKLNAPIVIREVTAYLVKNPQLMDNADGLKWYAILDKLQDEKLKAVCMQQILHRVLRTRNDRPTLGGYSREDWMGFDIDHVFEVFKGLRRWAHVDSTLNSSSDSDSESSSDSDTDSD